MTPLPAPGIAPRSRIVECDAFRGIATVLVVLQHTIADGVNIGGSILLSPLPAFFGLRVFFILSGYLITGILLDARSQNGSTWSILRAFHLRRMLRIFPLYYAVLLVCILVGIDSVRNGWLSYFTYTQNFRFASMKDFEHGTGHLWSLAVEEQFYVLWPILVLLTPARLLPWIMSACLGIGLIARTVLLLEWNVVAAYTLMPARIDALALGGLLAWLQRTPSAEVPRMIRAWRRTWIWSGLGLIFLAYVMRYIDRHALPAGSFTRKPHGADVLGETGYVLLGTWFLSRLIAGLPKPWDTVFRWRPAVYLGQISYGIYVIHLLVPAFVEKFGPSWFPLERGWPHGLAVLTTTIVIAVLSWHLFENPVNNLRRLFPYAAQSGRRGEPAPAAIGVPMST